VDFARAWAAKRDDNSVTRAVDWYGEERLWVRSAAQAGVGNEWTGLDEEGVEGMLESGDRALGTGKDGLEMGQDMRCLPARRMAR
jgi:hypothetical protein